MSRTAFGLLGLGLIAALVTGCGHATAGPAQAPSTPAAVVTPAAATTPPATRSSATPSASTVTAVQAAGEQAAEQKSGLAAVQRDLNGIASGTGQTLADVSAGDSARAQNDNN